MAITNKSKLTQALNVMGYSITENAIKEFFKPTTKPYCITTVKYPFFQILFNVISYHIIYRHFYDCIVVFHPQKVVQTIPSLLIDVEYPKPKHGIKTGGIGVLIVVKWMQIIQGTLSQCLSLLNTHYCIRWNHSKDFQETLEQLKHTEDQIIANDANIDSKQEEDDQSQQNSDDDYLGNVIKKYKLK